MANDANITIIDTGFIKGTNENTQATSGNRANAGVAFKLKAKEIIPTSKLLGQANPTIGSLEGPGFDIGSVEAPQLKITGILDMDTAADMTLFYKLWQLTRTYGYKAVFYNIDATSTTTNMDRDKQMITLLANSHKDTTEPQGDIDIDNIIYKDGALTTNKDLTDVYHIHMVFTTFTPRQIGGNRKYTYELSGYIIPNGP